MEIFGIAMLTVNRTEPATIIWWKHINKEHGCTRSLRAFLNDGPHSGFISHTRYPNPYLVETMARTTDPTLKT
jgi:hypothetical protein